MTWDGYTILGIDPGSRQTGYGLIRASKAGEWIYAGSGCIAPKAKTLVGRIAELYAGIHQLIQIHKPAICAVEEVFVGQYPSAALKLSHVRGGIFLAAFHSGVEIVEYSARYVKQTITGHGAADKLAVKKLLQLRLNGLSSKMDPSQTFDALDALAIAMTHGLAMNSKSFMLSAELPR